MSDQAAQCIRIADFLQEALNKGWLDSRYTPEGFAGPAPRSARPEAADCIKAVVRAIEALVRADGGKGRLSLSSYPTLHSSGAPMLPMPKQCSIVAQLIVLELPVTRQLLPAEFGPDGRYRLRAIGICIDPTDPANNQLTLVMPLEGVEREKGRLLAQFNLSGIVLVMRQLLTDGPRTPTLATLLPNDGSAGGGMGDKLVTVMDVLVGHLLYVGRRIAAENRQQRSTED